MGGAISALVVFGVLILVGLPIALSIRGTRPEWTGLAFESAVIGLVVELVVAMTLVHASHYNAVDRARAHRRGRGGADRRRAVLRRAQRAHRPPTPRCSGSCEPALVGLATLALIVVAVRIRHAPSYFLFQTGDMGGYVNGANILLVKGGTLARPPAAGVHALPARDEPAARPGAHRGRAPRPRRRSSLLGVVAFARTLKLHVAVALGFAFLIAIHPVMVWFSLFPVSEALFAPLLLALLLLPRARPVAALVDVRGDRGRRRRARCSSCAASRCCSRRSS